MAGERERGVYMISVAAELAGMHPQTLRIYESRGLIQPKRSPKNTRLYSDEDVQRLRRIQQLTSELGMNLAGVERVFELEQEVARMRRRLNNIERAAERAQEELRQEIARVRQAAKAELVPYEPPGQALAPREQAAVRIRVRRTPAESRFEEPRLLGMLSEHRQSTRGSPRMDTTLDPLRNSELHRALAFARARETYPGIGGELLLELCDAAWERAAGDVRDGGALERFERALDVVARSYRVGGGRLTVDEVAQDAIPLAALQPYIDSQKQRPAPVEPQPAPARRTLADRLPSLPRIAPAPVGVSLAAGVFGITAAAQAGALDQTPLAPLSFTDSTEAPAPAGKAAAPASGGQADGGSGQASGASFASSDASGSARGSSWAAEGGSGQAAAAPAAASEQAGTGTPAAAPQQISTGGTAPAAAAPVQVSAPAAAPAPAAPAAPEPEGSPDIDTPVVQVDLGDEDDQADDVPPPAEWPGSGAGRTGAAARRRALPEHPAAERRGRRDPTGRPGGLRGPAARGPG